MSFNAEKTKDAIISWIQDWFEYNGKECNAVIGISGGKDSTVTAALCAEALGADRVIGVLMPNGIQDDIEDAREVCKVLGIKSIEININGIFRSFFTSLINEIEFSKQTIENLPPRIRMSTLYAISQSSNGRVINTCNASENFLGYSTRWGDDTGDISPLGGLTVEEVVALGDAMNLPAHLVHKTPSDGLCGKTDEDNLGFSYTAVDKVLRNKQDLVEPAELEKIIKRASINSFKSRPISTFYPKGEYYI